MFHSRFFRRVVSVGLTAGIILCSRITNRAPDKIHAAPVFASFIVDSLLDDDDINPGNGVCDSNPDPLVVVRTLRAAIEVANALAGADVITFSVVGTITIGTELPADHPAGIYYRDYDRRAFAAAGGDQCKCPGLGTLVRFDSDFDKL